MISVWRLTGWATRLADKRYRPTSEVPDTVLQSMQDSKVFSPGFSIKGQRVEGRPAYLDFQVM